MHVRQGVTLDRSINDDIIFPDGCKADVSEKGFISTDERISRIAGEVFDSMSDRNKTVAMEGLAESILSCMGNK